MSHDTWMDLSVEAREKKFADILEHVDRAIKAREIFRKNPWRTMIGNATFTLGQGLSSYMWRFHPGLGDLAGLEKWRPIQISQTASGTSSGVDACNWNPYSVTYGMERVQWSGFTTERKTDPICVKDIRFLWEFKQQLRHIFGWLGDVRNSIVENWNRETYIKYAVDNGNAVVFAGGTPTDYTITYDPFALDTDGDNVITIDAGVTDLSSLNWKPLRWINRWLETQAPMANIGTDASNRPVYGIVLDMEDFDDMIERDPQLREDWRNAKPEVLIRNFGTVTNYKGYAMMHDPFMPRFSVKSQDGSNITLKREVPQDATTSVTIGNRVHMREEYMNAEFALGVILLSDVFHNRIPPAGPTSPGGGTHFGSTPGLNGMWKWLNITDKDDNPFNEIGQYVSRHEMFPYPDGNEQEAFVFLYRRCPHIDTTSCDIGGDDIAVDGEQVALASTPAAGDIDATKFTITLTLDKVLNCETLASVTLVEDGGAGATSFTGIVSDASQAPTYEFALTVDPGAAANWTFDDGASTPYVTCN